MSTDPIEAHARRMGYELIDDATASASDIIVCGHPPGMPGALHAACADCGTAIVYGPTAPRDPVKLCLACAVKRIAALPEAERRRVRLVSTRAAAAAAVLHKSEPRGRG